MSRPNILLILTDQQRWDAMSCSGDWVRTPHLDRIAAEGMRFANCVPNSPVCIPARLSLATGLYPHNTGVWHNQPSQPSPEQPTWMQTVRAAGYRTSLFGKTHLHPHHGDLRQKEDLMRAYGLDDVDEIGGPRASARLLSHMTASWRDRGKWEAYQRDFEERFSNKPHVVRPSSLSLEDYADVYVGQRAREYLESYDRAEPWCCWVSFGGPHEPWDAPEPYASMYDPSTMPPPVAHSPQDHPRPQGELDRLLANRPDLTPDEVAAMRANYAGNVSLIDDQIGQILAAVEARGELGNTAIAFSSDHGEHNGDCGLIYKETFLNGAVRVPLLLRTPATARGSQSDRICSAPVEWFDIGPTLVELAGGEIDYPQFARSLTPLLEDPTRRHRGEAISELKGEIMLLDERWKGALNAEGQVYMLFDVQSDPEESTNLAGLPEMRATEEKLRLRILERLVQSQLRGSAYRFDLHQS